MFFLKDFVCGKIFLWERFFLKEESAGELILDGCCLYQFVFNFVC